MVVPAELASRVDRVLYSLAASTAEVEAVCAEAEEQRLRAVCVPGSRIALVAARLEETPVKTVALVGLPLGAADSDVKRYETEVAVDCGAQEIEVALNHGWLKEGNSTALLRELRDVSEAADVRPVCVVLEPSRLLREEVILACHLILDSGATGVAAGSGFWPDTRATVEQVALLRAATSPEFIVKAAVDNWEAQAAQALLDAGATRLGLASR